MTWLIVEDDPDIRNIVQVMCTVWGHPTLAFPDGDKAWKWLDEVNSGAFNGDLPEFALLDIRMPGYTGDVVAGRIRQTEKLCNIPIVLMTAYTLSDADRERIMTTSGADKMIPKPLPDLNELKDMLYNVIKEKRFGHPCQAGGSS